MDRCRKGGGGSEVGGPRTGGRRGREDGSEEGEGGEETEAERWGGCQESEGAGGGEAEEFARREGGRVG